ncbi:MAG: hypothetical protein MUE46_09295 [Xanthomonadales bacterium]|nr:hypothetical protein [Xanthomonadales bacterium]
MRTFSIIAFALLAGSVQAQTTPDCGHRLLLSGYFSNNVHVYNACDGRFERLLDSANRIAGAQATRVSEDGKLHVVSEGNGRILRYDAASLEYLDTPITLPPDFGATGLALNGEEVWVAGYNYNGVRRYGPSGEDRGVLMAPGSAGLAGADNGMTLGPDGLLYVPGYDSHNVVRRDSGSGQTSVFIARGAGGLNQARGILFEPGGQTLLVSSEGNGRVLRYRADGNFLGTAISGLNRPTGLAYHPDGSLLVADVSGIRRYDPASYAARGLLADAIAGGVSGPTFITVVPTGPALDLGQIGSQYWITGLGVATARRIEVADMYSTYGLAFGADFDPAQRLDKRWGSLRIEFSSCNAGVLSWNSTTPPSAGFGNGSYPIQRLIPSAAGRRCEQQGFAGADELAWVAGTWFGGAARNGEGLMIDHSPEGLVFVSWFTHRPRPTTD